MSQFNQNKSPQKSWIKKAFLAAALLLTASTAAQATNHSIHVEWGYTPPTEPDVSGYRLYQEGVIVHTVNSSNSPNPADERELDTVVDLTQTVTNFTLTATFTDNTESPHSAPFAFTTPSSGTETGTAPVIKKMAGNLQNFPYLARHHTGPYETLGFAGLHARLDSLYGQDPIPQAVAVELKPRNECTHTAEKTQLTAIATL